MDLKPINDYNILFIFYYLFTSGMITIYITVCFIILFSLIMLVGCFDLLKKYIVKFLKNTKIEYVEVSNKDILNDL